MHRRIQSLGLSLALTAGLAFGGTGRVRGVDGSCAKHLTVESYTIIWYSITHSLFHSRLKTFLFRKSF